MEDRKAGPYDDIIGLEHHQSSRRPHMSIGDRAAQFSPFAALTGYEDAIGEAGRLTDQYRERDENEKEILDEKLNALQAKRSQKPEVTIQYFVPDERKEGGRYEQLQGFFVKADGLRKTVTLETDEGKKTIGLEMIAEIASPLFEGMEQF